MSIDAWHLFKFNFFYFEFDVKVLYYFIYTIYYECAPNNLGVFEDVLGANDQMARWAQYVNKTNKCMGIG